MNKPSARGERPTEELHGIWQHLVYEIQMCFEAGKMLSTFKPNEVRDEDRVIHNALIESFTIHARSLVAFLYPEDPRPDDVTGDDFFDDPSVWRKIRPTKTKALENAHPRVAKEVAHLTYARIVITEEQRRWPFPRIAADLGLALREFVRLLPDDFIKPLAIRESTSPPPIPPEGGPITEAGSKGLGG